MEVDKVIFFISLILTSSDIYPQTMKKSIMKIQTLYSAEEGVQQSET